MDARAKWDEVKPAFVARVNARGIADAVRAIPASQATVYRLMGSTTGPWHHRIREGVARYVADPPERETAP